jgi:hypothetical protein
MDGKPLNSCSCGGLGMKANFFQKVFITFWICSLCNLIWGQANVTGGALSGVVRDDSAAVIGNATVKVKNVETGLTVKPRLAKTGRFAFQPSPPEFTMLL